MCTAEDLASYRWNLRSVYNSVLAFWGGKKQQLGDLGGQIYKVKLIISAAEALFSLPLSFPSFLSTVPPFCLLWFYLPCLEVRGDWSLQMWQQGHISSLTSRCSFNPISPALCHSARADLKGTDWSNTKDGTLKKKKNLTENPIAFMLWIGSGGGEDGTERNVHSRISGAFSWFIQSLLCVGYSKSSILPHPGGKSSELHAWVVLHLTAAMQKLFCSALRDPYLCVCFKFCRRLSFCSSLVVLLFLLFLIQEPWVLRTDKGLSSWLLPLSLL